MKQSKPFSSNSIDMVTGPLLKNLLLFSLPLMATNILQLLFNAADVVVVGRYASYASLAAVGSTTAIVNLVVNLLFGISVGVNVLIARYLGAGDRGDEISAAVHTAVALALIGGIVLGYIWSMIFDGILVKYNTSVVLESKYGFWGLIILMCWQQVGYMMIIYIAGLQSIPEDMLEAARIDGATDWQMLWKVTIPNMMSSFTICIFLTLTNGFKLFDQNLALTGGRPFLQQPDGSVIKTTEMLALNIYNAFYSGGGNNRGVGQAKAVVFFILVAAISLIQLQSTRKKEVQQ